MSDSFHNAITTMSKRHAVLAEQGKHAEAAAYMEGWHDATHMMQQMMNYDRKAASMREQTRSVLTNPETTINQGECQ